MKIGILTFCNAMNLGAALQALALQKKLEQLGHDAELIDYRCPAIEAMHRLKPVFRTKSGVKTRIYNLISNIVFFPRRLRYRSFRRYSKRSKPYTRESIVSANGDYDVFLSGSDQVFNWKLTVNDPTFFLDFVHSGKKVSYAASLGVWLPEKKEQYRELLSSFDRLSVREASTAELFRQELGIEAEVIPDPVFLHSGEEWKKLLRIRAAKPKEKYLLVYSLIEKKELYQIAAKQAERLGLKTVAITKALKPAGKADRYVRNAGPREFIRLLSGAEYVVTNSFHGTAFSLIFEKQFTTLLPDAAPERIMDLLDAAGLRERACLDTEKLEQEPIHFSIPSIRRRQMADRGASWLKRALV